MRALAWLIGKDGEPSKTAVMLWLAYLSVIFKYVFANQVLGTPWGDYPVGPFDEVEAITILSLVSGLYFGSNRIWLPGQTANITKKPPEGSTSPVQSSPPTQPAPQSLEAPQTQPSHPMPIDPALFVELVKLLPRPPFAPAADPVESPPSVPPTAPALPIVDATTDLAPGAEDTTKTEPFRPQPPVGSPND